MKKIIALTLGLALLLSLSVTALAAPSATFRDVREGDWFAGDVKYVYEHGLMSGGAGQSFAVNSPATRAMLVTILHRLEGAPGAVDSGFRDVAPSAYYASAVGWALDAGIVTGMGNAYFAPDQAVSREQLAVILYRYAQYKGWDTAANASLSGYRDQGQVSDYAVSALRWALGKGLISGTSSDTLAPKGSAQRVQVAAILHRFCENVARRKPAANGNTLVLAPALPDVLNQMPQNFTFASGVGGWATTLTLYADGTFQGVYQDADMGVTGPGYPGGTLYECYFTGSFDTFTQVSPYQYNMRLAELNTARPEGESWIQDDIRHIASGPYGIEGGTYFSLYLPGCSIVNLPDEYVDWVRMPLGWYPPPSTLPFFGLYNISEKNGFFSGW